MKSKSLTSILVLIISIIVILILNFFMAHHIYESEKEDFTLHIDSAIRVAIIYTNYLPDNADSSTDYIQFSNEKIKIRIRKSEFIYDPDTTNNLYAFVNQIHYDIRDTAQWNLKHLYKFFKEALPAYYPNFPISFMLKDSAGNTLDQLPEGRLTSRKIMQASPVSLGNITKHTLYAHYHFPFRLFFINVWDKLALMLGLIILLIIGMIVLFRQYQKEKFLSQKQDELTHLLIHNLRAPVLRGQKSLEVLQLKSADRLSEKQQHLLENTQKHINDFLEGIENILTLSVKPKGLTPHYQSFHLENILKELCQSYQQNCGTKQIHIRINNQVTAPVWADPTQLQGSLGNLLANAIKYSGETVEIQVNCRKEKQELVLSVRDNGFGIAPEDQPHIFDYYYRGKYHDGTQGSKGYGLGLNYVMAVVKAHKGEIQVHSDGKTGTEFILEFPKAFKA